MNNNKTLYDKNPFNKKLNWDLYMETLERLELLK